MTERERVRGVRERAGRARARRADRPRAGAGAVPRGVVPALRRGPGAPVPDGRHGGAGGPRHGAAGGLRGAALRSDGRDRVRRRRRRFRPSRWVPAVVAVAAAALALGLGLTVTSSPPPTATAPAHHGKVVTADLVSNGATVGHVVTFGGDQPWMSMMLADSSARGTVDCIVVTADGVRPPRRDLRRPRGLRGLDRPAPRQPGHIRTAEVESPSGTVIATATLG